MRFVMMSDTHMRHASLSVPDGDVLIHAGDACNSGTQDEFTRFAKWFSSLPHATKLYVPGNHDVFTQALLGGTDQRTRDVLANHRMAPRPVADPDAYLRERFGSPYVHVLVDSWIIVQGVKFYGSPWVPECGWAWGLERRSGEMRRVRDAIPDDTDVLITHTPPHGTLDGVPERLLVPSDPIGSIGCEDLADRVRIVQPRLHVFGHVHQGVGSKRTAWGGWACNVAQDVDVFDMEDE